MWTWVIMLVIFLVDVTECLEKQLKEGRIYSGSRFGGIVHRGGKVMVTGVKKHMEWWSY